MGRWNPRGIVIAIAFPFVGWCFGGQMGAGLATIIVILIQLA